MATGVVARFDIRRGYGFVIPDDGGEDVFVHQNNINMEGFRYLQPGERVQYELEVGEKGMKAVSVGLTEPRPPGASPFKREENGDRGGYDRPERGDRGTYDRGDRGERPFRREGYSRDNGGSDRGERLGDSVDKLRRRQERLISLLVSKGILNAGEIDSLDAESLDH